MTVNTRDHADRDQLPHAELERPGDAEEVQRVLVPERLEAVDVGHEDRDRRAVGGDRGAAQHEGVAGEQEPRHLPVRPPQIHVLSAGVRQQRPELGEAQRAEHRHQPRGHPRGQHQRRGCPPPAPCWRP